MQGLSDIYSHDFFAEWGRSNAAYVETARVIAEILYSQYQPKRAVDLGCGCGVFGHFLSAAGVEVVSIDGVEPPTDCSFPVKVEVRDLTEPLANEWGAFDMTLCIEVAEHIPEDLSGVLLGNIIQFSPVLVMSAARPGQGGHHHVNEQPRGYWHKRLKELGFDYSRKRTGVFQEEFKSRKPPLGWMGHHVDIYVKRDGR